MIGWVISATKKPPTAAMQSSDMSMLLGGGVIAATPHLLLQGCTWLVVLVGRFKLVGGQLLQNFFEIVHSSNSPLCPRDGDIRPTCHTCHTALRSPFDRLSTEDCERFAGTLDDDAPATYELRGDAELAWSGPGDGYVMVNGVEF
jgi:hypothetical protein